MGDGKKGRSDLAIAIGVVGGLIAIASALAFIPAGSLFGRGISVTGIIVALFQCLEVLGWVADEDWKDPLLQPMLWHVLLVRAIALGALIVTGFSVTSAEALVIVASCVLGILLLSHLRTPGRIQLRVADRPAKSPRPRRVHVAKDDGHTMELILKLSRSSGETVVELLNVFGQWRRLPRYAWLIIAILLIICSMAVARGLITGTWPGEGAPAAAAPPATTVTPTTTTPQIPSDEGQPTAHVTLTAGASETRPEWDGECPTNDQQVGLSTRAGAALHRLYEHESQLGPAEEGCISQISDHRFRGEFYATTIGTNPVTHQRLSYGIDSERYGTVLFLWPVVPLIETLISEVGPIGGVVRFPHYMADTGDFYVVRTPEGTFVFIRKEATESYLRIAPQIARAWLGQMKEVNQWLWPTTPEPQPDGEEVIQLRSNELIEQIVGTVEWNAKKGVATRDRYTYSAKPVHELNLSELEGIAAKA